MQKVRAVVAMAKGAAVSVQTINVPDPGPGEAVVKIAACGVCHTDLHYREGGINDEVVPARPVARSATTTQSSSPSRRSCSCFPTRPSCIPATATTQRSVPRRRTWLGPRPSTKEPS